MTDIMELRAKRANLWEAAKAFLDTHTGKDGKLSQEDSAAYDRMEADVVALGKDIERLERQTAIDKELAQPAAAPITNAPGGKTEYPQSAYHDAVMDAIRSRFRKVSDVLQEGVDTDGGYLVPEEMDSRLVDVLTEENVMRTLGTTLTTSGERKINIAATKPAASWIEEGGALSFGDATFDQIILDAHKLHVAIKVTEELLYDNAFNLESYIIEQFGKAIAIEKSVFLVNDQTLAVIRKLKDNNNAYLWQPSYQAGEPDRLMGYAVYTSPYVPTVAAGAAVLAFGDYSYYNIGDRGTRTLQELKELFAGNGMVGYVMKERVDGKLILPEAVKLLKIKGTAAAKANG